MPERRPTLASAIFTVALIVALCAQSAWSLRAEDECIAKPNSSAPQGQHWYYRVDHANNRQCWRLGPEGLPIQKSAPKNDRQPLSEAAQPAAPPPAQQHETTGAAPADSAVPAMTTMTPWPAAPKVPALSPAFQPVQQPASAEWVQSASALDTMLVSNRVSTSVNDAAPASDTGAPASVSNASSLESNDAKDSQRTATAQFVAAAAPVQTIAEVDHTFALLMVVFALLAVTGPVHHYTERRRQREASNFRVPQWAPVVALNAPAPRVRGPLPPDVRRRYAPTPIRPADQTERLAQVLQQLVERMQMDRQQAHSAVTCSPQRAASR